MATPRHQGPGEEGYLASVSDLMVGLLFVFIIMLMAFALNFRGAQEEAGRTQDGLEAAQDAVALERDTVARERDALARERDELVRRHDALAEVAEQLASRDTRRAELLRAVADDLAGREVPVALDAANGVLRLPESLLFESGDASLRPEGERALGDLAAALAAELPCYSAGDRAGADAACPAGAGPLLEAVLIEGHTDEVPLRHGAYADNWQLSAARGVSMFKALTAAAPALEALRNTRGEALLGVAGYEARRPVATGGTPDARRLNRRIDLRFLVAAPDGGELAGLAARIRPEAAR